MWLPVMHQHIYYVYDHKCCYHQTGQCHNLKQENEFMHAKTFFLNTISIWFFWSIFRWLRNSRLPNSVVIWLSNHLKSPLIIKFIPVLLQPNKKNGSASEFVRNFKLTFPRIPCVEPDPEGPYLFDLFFGWYEFDLK